MIIVLFRSKVLQQLRRLNDEWRSVQNKRGEVTFLRSAIVLDVLLLLGLTDQETFVQIYGYEEGTILWQRETSAR
jgi:hypothetical protein